MRLNSFIFILAFMASACGGGAGGGATAGAPVIVTNTTSTTFLSKSTGVNYPVNIYVPSNYTATTDMLPVIFTLDGELTGDNFDGMRRILMDEGTRVILVGVATAGHRDFDYLLPGSLDFYKFLGTELIPGLEKQYRIDSKQRTLVGHSFGADFVQTALTLDRPDRRYFANFVAVDGPLRFPDQAAVLENAMYQASGGKMPDTTFIFASAGGAGFNTDVEAAYQNLLARNYQGLNLIRLPAYKTDHGGVFIPAITDALHLLYKK
ncbi:alpha/beta hydrolase [Undibacterium sp. TJN19]|uniref:alpha/beta hydrolase n=1 Tax=Undibacterium sp. TJN19 TaxID=3413055 RepID=UPI003BF1EA87